MTMIDGKTINVIEGNKATTRCHVCRCSSKELNNLNNMDATADFQHRNELKYGISPLHARIKFMEFLLHLSYRLTLPEESRKKGFRKTAEEKQIILDRKIHIQNQFREKLGLIVDIPKPGFGSSNTGNTAREFFEHSKISSEITGIDENLINRFYIILTAINTCEEVDAQKFAAYARETAQLLIAKYSWWYMSPTVHKILLHGGEMISYAILPLGMLSEEAQEHCNKNFKVYRSQYARRCSRINNLNDVFKKFLVASDPKISGLRDCQKIKGRCQNMPTEVQAMLKNKF